MANSYQTHTLNTGTAGPFSFAEIDGYLSIDHIKVYADGTLQNTAEYTIDEVNKEITFNAPLTVGSVVLIQRQTPKTTLEREVTFTSGAIVRPDDLNTAHLQTMFIAQETEDQAIKDPPADAKNDGFVLTWDTPTNKWVASVPTGGDGTGGVGEGTYGDIEVGPGGADWQIRSGVVTTTEMGGDVTAAGKNMITAASAAAQRSLLGLGTASVFNVDYFAVASHTHAISDITLLQNTLDGKAAVGHTHTIANVTGLQTALDGKANTSHLHAISDVSGLQTALDSKAAVSHTHSPGDITGLATVATTGAYNDLSGTPTNATTSVAGLMSASDKTKLNGIASGAEVNVNADWNANSGDAEILNKPTIPVNLGDLSNVSSATATAGQVLKYDGTQWAPGTDATQGGAGTDADLLDGQDGTYYLNRANHTGTQAISTITNLQNSLDGKATTSHTHTLADVTDSGTAASRDVPASGNAITTEVVLGNDTRLSDARTPTSHTHPISDVVNLQTELNDKANTTHSHIIGDVTGLQTALDDKADGTHTHLIADVTGLQTALDGKAASSHTHAISDVTNLQSELNSKVSSGVYNIHTHQVTGNYAGHVETPSDKDYYIDLDCPAIRTLTKFTAVTDSGTCSAAVYIGATLVGTLSVSSTIGNFTPVLNNVTAVGDVVKVVISSNNSAAELRFSLRYTQNTGTP